MKDLDFRKKNHPSWSSYDREILYTSFNSRLKRKRSTIPMFFILIS